MNIAGVNVVTQDPQILAQEVLLKNGKVDPATARRFLNNVFYEGVQFTNSETGQQGLSALPLAVKLGLYEAVASEGHHANAAYLTAINAELGLDKAFYDLLATNANTFLENPARLDAQWQFAGNTSSSFSNVMSRFAKDGANVSVQEKMDVVQFLVGSYAAHSGVGALKVEFFEGKPGDAIASQSGDVIKFNTNSDIFQKTPLELVGVVIHEVDHRTQQFLGMAYQQGMLPPEHPLHTHGRVCHANHILPFGYVSGKEGGYDAYRIQPIEVASHFSQEQAMVRVNRIWGNVSGGKPDSSQDGPVRSNAALLTRAAPVAQTLEYKA